MFIMSIFIVLTVVFVIGTAIYLNYKKKNNNSNLKQNDNKEAKEKGKKKSKKQLADILKIKIKDNIIAIDNRYSTIINELYKHPDKAFAIFRINHILNFINYQQANMV